MRKVIIIPILQTNTFLHYTILSQYVLQPDSRVVIYKEFPSCAVVYNLYNPSILQELDTTAQNKE